MNEIWKTIKNTEHKYEVSNLGNVRSVYAYKHTNGKTVVHIRTKTLKPQKVNNGYMCVYLCVNKKHLRRYVHRLVVAAHISDIPSGMVIDHIDYDKSNNAASNLQILTQKENVQRSVHLMKGMRTTSNSSTGEMYISYRKKYKKYRLTIGKIEYKGFDTLAEAVTARDLILGEIDG